MIETIGPQELVLEMLAINLKMNLVTYDKGGSGCIACNVYCGRTYFLNVVDNGMELIDGFNR
jgi:hypothetical protein